MHNIYFSASDLEGPEFKGEHLGLDSDTDGLADQRKKKKRKHKHHKHKKDKLIEREDERREDRQERYSCIVNRYLASVLIKKLYYIPVFVCRRKHKKHKRQKREKDIENGTMDEKLVSNVVHKEVGMNGKAKNSVLEILSTEESEDEKLVDLDSDEVDCTIIEDDIDLEELMKQKVHMHF